MKTQFQPVCLARDEHEQQREECWQSFVKRHWLLGPKVLGELRILIRLAGSKNGHVNGRSSRRTPMLRLKRAA